MIWILLVLAVAIVVGLLRGGKLSNLTEIRVRVWWLLFLGFGMQVVERFLPPSSHELAVALVLLSYIPLLVFVWINRQNTGIWIAGIGVMMNFTVMVLNGGMPVSAEAAAISSVGGEVALGAKHVLLDAETRLPFLADIIPLPRAVLSLGDVFLAIGVGLFLEDHMRRPVRLFAHGAQGTPGSAAEQ